MAQVKKEVSLLRMRTPLFLSLVDKPANEVAFKVVRSDLSGKGKRRVKRSAVLYVALPPGATVEEAEALAGTYGLVGYDVLEGDDGSIVLKRHDLKTIPDEGFTRFGVGGGVTMGVELSKARSDDVSSGLAVARFEFDCNHYTSDTAKEYLSSCGIDTSDISFDTADNALVYVREDVGVDTETRRITVDNGVILEVMRAETVQLPANLVAVVSEVAYGQWGWGQLDFAAAMADVEFSNAAEEATYKLRSILDRILFYSELPITIRKELVTRACGQFAYYVNSLMDALPEQVIMAVSDFVQRMESDMSDKEKTATGAGDDVGTAKETTISRDDVVGIVKEVIAGDDIKTVITAAVADAIRSETATEGADKNKPATEDDGATVSRSDDGLAASLAEFAGLLKEVSTSMSSVQESVTSVAKRMDDIENATVVRSDSGDNAVGKSKDSKTASDPFRGAIFGPRN